MTDYAIRRLEPANAAAISACFQRVYGTSYGNPLFYDVDALAEAMRAGHLCCVGAYDPDDILRGHMAMTTHPGAGCAELGNTVVDPAARGGGLAWQVGAELTRWCRESGYWGFLHYPTTDHHIMQRHSVKTGFETGLMLGYIPADTDGQVKTQTASLRQAATIVYEPLAAAPALRGFLPPALIDQIGALNEPLELKRQWLAGDEAPVDISETTLTHFQRRGLSRLNVVRTGADISAQIDAFRAQPYPCLQLDLSVADPAISTAYDAARAQGFRFCGWLPGFTVTDVVRMQWVDEALTDMHPAVVNPTAQALLDALR